MPTTTAHETLAAAVADAQSSLEVANDFWRSAERVVSAAQRHANVVGDLCRAAERALEEAKEALAAAG